MVGRQFLKVPITFRGGNGIFAHQLGGNAQVTGWNRFTRGIPGLIVVTRPSTPADAKGVC